MSDLEISEMREPMYSDMAARGYGGGGEEKGEVADQKEEEMEVVGVRRQLCVDAKPRSPSVMKVGCLNDLCDEKVNTYGC
jgi:hypothetical protein